MIHFLKKLFSFKQKRNYRDAEIAPDEIFLDASNLPDLDNSQFEGRLEKPISKKAIRFSGAFFALVLIVFSFRLVDLQVTEAGWYRGLALENRLRESVLFANRGNITDRNGNELVWNQQNEEEQDDDGFAKRSYTDQKGFSHLLGYVSYPQADNKGIFYQTDYQGKAGVEKFYNGVLSGYNGTQQVELNALQDVVAENAAVKPVSGQNLQLSVDERVQNKMYTLMEDLSNQVGFEGGAGAIMDIDTGELLALDSYPEYNSSVMTDGENREEIQKYNMNAQTPFLNRAVSGLYTPGSIVKPVMALAGLNEGVINENTIIVSDGTISIPNPYFPGRPTVFYDWKAHGPIDVRGALAHSSNIFFYEVGGGFQGQPGIGIQKINEYMNKFGVGQPTGMAFDEATGVIPNPSWKEKVFPSNSDWRIGDTYNTSIGQYGFQVTPLQMVRATAAVANDGKLLTPTVVKTNEVADHDVEQIDIPQKYFDIVQEGMRLGVLEGTASGLNTSAVDVAAKTGTAELDAAKSRTNSWVVGYFPYEDPQYAFTVVMESGPYSNHLGGVYIMRQLLDWMGQETPEYLD